MKKILPITVLVALLLYACSSAKLSPEMKKESNNIAFEYTAMTRGAYKKVIVKHDTLITLQTRDMANAEVKKPKDKAWNGLLLALQKVNLDSFSEYPAPTDKRKADAAMMANLKVFINGKTYESKTFDHGYPPQQVKELTDKIVEVSDLDNKGISK